MRAALAHLFGRELGLGTSPWTECEDRPGMYTGNPVLSLALSQYMTSLKRRKTHAGETVVSAKAETEGLLRKKVEFNENYQDSEKAAGKRSMRADDQPNWKATSTIRHQLNFIYIISFLCLLRFEEALRIEWHWLTLEPDPDGLEGSLRLRLDIPWRKTHQTGNIAPFYLYEDLEKPWLDPILALSRLIVDMEGKPLKGFVCRKRMNNGRPNDDPDAAMSSTSFLNCLRCNLLEVGEDPRPYGTHSFRRGGCQYLAITLRWSIRQICAWGSWANRQESNTVFKYLLSFVDEVDDREHYFNKSRQTGTMCLACRRSCNCAR
ncbi:hypothetical protein PENSPDRAFT_742880 [Peniophora sp. CONT]|nr:hypothetical protein PENSPDRAFT_742880 [Peniophora sp. CONT]